MPNNKINASELATLIITSKCDIEQSIEYLATIAATKGNAYWCSCCGVLSDEDVIITASQLAGPLDVYNCTLCGELVQKLEDI